MSPAYTASEISPTGPARTIPAPWANAPWRWLAIDFAVWAGLGLIWGLQIALRSPQVSLGHIIAQQIADFGPCALLTPSVAMVAHEYRFSRGRVGSALFAHTIGALVYVVVGGAMMGMLAWSMPWSTDGQPIWAAAWHAVVVYVAIDILLYASTVAAVQAIVFSREAQQREVHEATLQAQLADARLNALTAQLQPHFLFNTLNAISALVREEPQQAERLLARLSELLRHSLQGGTSTDVALVDELAFIEKYAELQEARFGDHLQFTFDVEPGVLDARVPRLLLQPLVENAVRHGTARRAGDGHVAIGAERLGRWLRLTVRDDGVGLPVGRPPTEGIGLSATRARLRQVYGAEYQFVLGPNPKGGTLCTVEVPMRTGTHA